MVNYAKIEHEVEKKGKITLVPLNFGGCTDFEIDENNNIVKDLVSRLQEVSPQRNITADYTIGSEGRIVKADIRSRDELVSGSIQHYTPFRDLNGRLRVVLQFISQSEVDMQEYLSLGKAVKTVK